MALKDINWKQFFIEKGERVGLAVTAVLMVALTVVSLFLPNHGFLVPSPTANAKVLNEAADRVDQRRTSAKPTDADKPPPVPTVPVLFEKDKLDNYKDYEVALRWLPLGGSSSKRRMPELFQCDEGTAAVAFSQIRSYILDSSEKSIMVHSGAAPAAAAAPAGAPAQPAAAPPGGGFIPALRQGVGARTGGPVGNIGIGAPGGPVGRPGLGGGAIGGGAIGGGAIGTRAASALRAPTTAQSLAPAGSTAGETRFVNIDEISENSQPRYAETVRPLRQAIIVATFPYRKEILEFQRKLHLESIGDVLAENWEEPDNDGSALPSFRFLGVDVQRREIDPEGKPGPWRPLDLAESLRPFVKLNGRNFEPEPPGLEKLKIDGLVMPLLVQFKENRYNHYPQPEMELANVRKTLKDLEGKKDEEIVKHENPINNKDPFNPFRPRRAAAGGARAAAAAAPGADPEVGGDPRSLRGGARPGGRRPGGAAPAARGTQPGANPEQAVPEHVLVRVVDVNIEPGKVYEYRLHVRMANPNYKRINDVLSPSYAVEQELQSDKELKDSDWFVVPKKVSVPPEFYYYAVDQKDLDGDQAYKLLNRLHARDNVSRDQQAVFQIHRWLENAAQGGRESKDFFPVGEWTVAERVIVSRGEYVGRTERVDVPIWNTPSESFILAQPGDNKRRRETGIEVEFSLPNDDAILVDFEGGPQQFVRKSTRGERPETVKLDEKISTEVLLVSSDGRVTARNAAYDAANPERVGRLDTWRNRVREVAVGGHSPAAGPMNPFAPGGGRVPAGAPGGGRRPGAGGPTVN